MQNAGPYNEDSLVGVPDEVNTGEQFGSDEKVNVCKFPAGLRQQLEREALPHVP